MATPLFTLDVVSHCWRYPRILAYCLSSFLDHPPTDPAFHVNLKIFFTDSGDDQTGKLLEYFARLDWPANVRLIPWHLPRPRLMRRAIGRNMAALQTQAAWAWFADCDHLVGPNCLDSFPQALAAVPAEIPLAFPRTIQQSRSHQFGDRDIFAVTLHETDSREIGERLTVAVPPINPAHFKPKSMNRAIGGIQIVRGDFARARGYLPRHRRYQKPIAEWARTKEDAIFRACCKTKGHPLDIPNIFRLRHSKRGRFHVGIQL